jgi:gliding motility-associated-like protein
LQVNILIAMQAFLRLLFTVFFIGMAFLLPAQLCTGSLGDAVVNITFGSGGGNNTGYTPTNAYTFTSSSCPIDGAYTITNVTSSCFNNSWHTVNADHTGNGAFMLVNASYAPGDFFITTVTGLCPNTTYEFAAWLMNVLKRSGIKPNITFTIETVSGRVLQSFFTGDIAETPQPQWKQYGFYFSTPVNNPQIVLRMTNNAPGGDGNDIALDDITFRPCSSVTLTSAIQGNNNIVDICDGNTSSYIFESAISTGYANPVFQWQLSADSAKTWTDIPNATTLTYQRNVTGFGSYWYRVTVTEKTSAAVIACRIASNNVVINVHAKPYVNAGANRVMIAKDAINLDGKVTGQQVSYYWAPPDNLSDVTRLDAMATPFTDKVYTLFATTPFGCNNQDDVAITVVGGIYVPNIFTPNNDGKNDNWRIPFLHPLFGATVNVFNRLGQLVYHTVGATVDWDGNFKGLPQPTGAYIYSIQFKNAAQNLRGSFMLTR